MNYMLPAALLIAWTLDALFAEPSDACHPVAWLGRLLGPLGTRLCRRPAPAAFAGGALVWLLIASVLGAATHAGQAILLQWPAPLEALLLALLLKPCFAWRRLRDEVAAVEDALSQSLAAGRDRVARLVSRDVTQLDDAGVRETAVQTLVLGVYVRGLSNMQLSCTHCSVHRCARWTRARMDGLADPADRRMERDVLDRMLRP